jgi:magnesium chelatase family protein
VISARQRGFRRFLLPADNAAECACIEDVELYPLGNLTDLIEHLCGKSPLRRLAKVVYAPAFDGVQAGGDLCFVRGQKAAKRALEVAAGVGTIYHDRPARFRQDNAGPMPSSIFAGYDV